jgi:uncharacterized protein
MRLFKKLALVGSILAFSIEATSACLPCSAIPCGQPQVHCCGTGSSCALPDQPPTTTPTGVALDTPWKLAVYQFAQKNVVHPAWGIAHSERDYQVSKELARLSNIALDEDVLFVSAYLHDIGGIAPYDKTGVDHAQRSVEVIEPLLIQWGFNMAKWPAVKEMILGHTYYGSKPQSEPAQVFHDADVLDFMGVIGAARILAAAPSGKNTLLPSVNILTEFAKTMLQNCLLAACTQMAQPRQVQLNSFLQILNQQSFNGKAL